MQEPFFTQLNSASLSMLIGTAKASVCYAAPGIQAQPAKALIEIAQKIGKELITVCLDVDENVVRMGYGELEAVEQLQQAGIHVEHIAGLRNGLVVVDGQGYSYTPTALLLENDTSHNVALNAMRLTTAQAAEAMSRLSPSAKAIAIAQADTPEKKQFVQQITSEIKPEPVHSEVISQISDKLKTAPPAKFDIARQVRVFQPYFQYVELSLTGAAIQRRKLNIPKLILNFGNQKELEGRLKTTFDLIDKSANITSKPLDDELRDIRTTLTRSLGKSHGRIIIIAAKARLEERLEQLKNKIQKHQEAVEKELETVLNASREMIVNHYLPNVKNNLPDDLIGSAGATPTDVQIKAWLDNILAKAFPEAKELIKQIKLEVNFKDVTYGTLTQENFMNLIKTAYPEMDWSKPYNEFLAAGESTEQNQKG